MTEQVDTIPSAAVAAQGTDWWAEAKGVFWLILAVLGFHSFIAKPFYIPSESMMPGLLKGDRLVVTKYPYGWSFVSPTFHLLPFMNGRILGSLPERGDVVIASPPGVKQDYIKRVIGLPGDRIEVRGGIVILNGVPIKRGSLESRQIPIDVNTPCNDGLTSESGGADFCVVPVYRETLPNGRSYDTIDLGNRSQGDDFAAITVPENHVFLMGDNRDNSSDSRFPVDQDGLGGPVPWENIGGRAEFITFSLDGTTRITNPVTWFSALRSGRAGSSLRPSEEK
ncbi:MAG: signal peptidase I [Pseudomonadota bacterium]